MRDVAVLLEEGIKRGMCAVCHVAARNGFDLCAELIGSLGTDRQTGDVIREGGGLCTVHAWTYARMATDASLNELYQDLLVRAADHLEATGRPLLPPQRCYVCIVIGQRQRQALDLWLEMLRQPEGRERYRRTRGLCLRHLGDALRYDLDPEVRALLVSHGAETLRRLAQWLRENARKHKALLRHELTREERAAPDWVVWQLASLPDATET